MPLYVYKCEGCGHEFEDLVSYPKRDDPKACTKCGKGSKRLEVTIFAMSAKPASGTTLVSPNEIDRAVGADAEKRWNWLETRRNKRWSGLKPRPIETPRGKDGSFRPVEVLGEQKDKKLRKVYSEARRPVRRSGSDR
jgi:putative FmdB family regulatory protein